MFQTSPFKTLHRQTIPCLAMLFLVTTHLPVLTSTSLALTFPSVPCLAKPAVLFLAVPVRSLPCIATTCLPHHDITHINKPFLAPADRAEPCLPSLTEQGPAMRFQSIQCLQNRALPNNTRHRHTFPGPNATRLPQLIASTTYVPKLPSFSGLHSPIPQVNPPRLIRFTICSMVIGPFTL